MDPNSEVCLMLIHLKDTVRIVFKSYFVNLFAVLFSPIKTVRAIDHNPGHIADVLIRVHDAFWDQ